MVDLFMFRYFLIILFFFYTALFSQEHQNSKHVKDSIALKKYRENKLKRKQRLFGVNTQAQPIKLKAKPSLDAKNKKQANKESTPSSSTRVATNKVDLDNAKHKTTARPNHIPNETSIAKNRAGTSALKKDSLEAQKQEAPVVLPIDSSLWIESLTISNTEIKDLLQGLAVQYNLNLFISPQIKGKTSVNFSKLPLVNVLKFIIEENDLSYSVKHGAIKVFPKPKVVVAPPKPKEKLEIQFENNKLSLDLDKAPLKAVTREIIKQTKLVLIVDPSADVKVNAFLQDVEVKQALQLLASSNNLNVEEQRGVFTFYKESWNTASGKGNKKTTGITRKRGGGRSTNTRGRRNLWVEVKENKVSMEVKQAAVGDVLSSLVQQSGINTVIYGEVSGNITAKVKGIPLEDALRYLFRETGFTFWVNHGIYFIGPQKMQNADNSKLIVMKHMKAEEIIGLLPKSLVEGVNIKSIKTQNALMLLGAYDDIEAISDYIEKIDQPIPQILIEALVVDVDMDKIREYGVNLFIGNPSSLRTTENEALYPSISQVLNREQTQKGLDKIPYLRDVISLPKNFAAQIEALEAEKALVVRSRPQIATLNGNTATITVGQTQYYLLKSETDYNSSNALTNKTTERFEKIEANVNLTVTPFVTGKGEVTVEIIPDFSEPEGSFDAGVPPTLNRRNLKSTVRLRDGETIILGGLVKESKQRIHSQVPFLGSIPVLGWLFKNTRMVTLRSQLMIFVTPRIYYGEDAKVDVEEVLDSLND